MKYRRPSKRDEKRKTIPDRDSQLIKLSLRGEWRSSKIVARGIKMIEKIKLRKKLTVVFNKFIRLRDERKGCISCVDGAVENAGHYHGTGAYPQPSMRFNEDNVHGQCIYCNMNLEGNRKGYEKGLIKRFGKQILEKLDVQRSLPQTTWTNFEFEAMIKNYQQKVKELEKGR